MTKKVIKCFLFLFQILDDYERFNSKIFQNSDEIKNIKAKKRDVEIKLKVQNCYRQKCAKINIQNNLEEIKSKVSLISTWLFRLAAVLILLSGILCYYKRSCIRWDFGIFISIIVLPIFINAFLSLYDFYVVPKFKGKC